MGKMRNHKHRGFLTAYYIVASTTHLVAAQNTMGFGVDNPGTELGLDILTRVNVERFADIALDIRDFRDLLAEGDSDAALELYREGRNSFIDQNVKFPLQRMSKDLKSLKPELRTPAYNYHLYGLAELDVTPSNLNNHVSYADTFVLPLINAKSPLAADAILALHAWMYGTHLLYQGVRTCYTRSKADNPDMFPLGGGGLDEFIALWIGADQTSSSDPGHSLYDLTQRAGAFFDKVRPNQPQAPANTNIKLLYEEGAVSLAIPSACSSGDSYTAPSLWSIANRIVSQMYIPLIQMLIDSLYIQDQDAIRLYAIALIPQVAQCRPSAFKRLKESLLDGTKPVSFDTIMSDLEASYDCFGLTCHDIGAYQIDSWAECPSVRPNKPLAEYVPMTEVHLHSKIDLDVLQLGILTSLSSYSFAHLLYMYGRNSPIFRQTENDPYRVRSLMQMATTSARKVADPFYTEFVAYFNDLNYADTVIQAALQKKGKWKSGSTEQIKQLVVVTSAFQVLYMNVLTELADAVAACNKGDMFTGEGGAHQWDEVAAFLIGSLEGVGKGGSGDLEDGQLFWSLANRRAFQFQTESTSGFALANVELENLLFAGRSQANVLDCSNLAKTVDRVQHIILLPVIQSTIRDAILIQGLNFSSTSGYLASAEAFTLSVLPIVARYEKDAAMKIRDNMILSSDGSAVRDGPQEVANAFYIALDNFGYSCSLVGATPQADACALEGGLENAKTVHSASRTTCTLFAIVVSLLMTLHIR